MRRKDIESKKTYPRAIVASKILVQWDDNPEMETVDDDMPDVLAQLFDQWLSSIEDKRAEEETYKEVINDTDHPI